jgi:hypothetical protein
MTHQRASAGYISQAFAQLLAGALYTYISPQLPLILLAVRAIPLSMSAFLRISDNSAREVGDSRIGI